MIKKLTAKKLSTLSWSLIRAVLIIGISFIIIYPLIVRITSSLMTETDLLDPTVKWVPRQSSLRDIIEHYSLVFRSMDYPIAFRNSFLLALVVGVFQLISCTFVGYGFGRFKFPGSNIFFALVIITLLIPPQMIMIPLFLNFRFFDIYGLIGETGVNLIGSFWPFIFLAMTATGYKNGLFIYITRQFFRGMPKDLEDAAYVDGAGPFKTFFKIMLPGAAPALLIVFLFSFVWQWNDIFYTSMFMPGNAALLPLTLETIDYGFDPWYAGGPSIIYTSMLDNIGMLMFVAPLVLVYAFLQRHFVESIERTGLVG